MYINNKLVDEGHKLLTMNVLQHISDKWENNGLTITEWSIQEDWIEERGDLPQLFSDIPDYIKGVQSEVSF